MTNSPECKRILECKQVLLVEGIDDKHVVKHICNRCQHQHIPEFGIIEKNGFDELARGIAPEIKVSGRTAVGIVVDANDEPGTRWQAVSDQLKKANVSVPKDMSGIGTITGERPRVGVWLMPDNQSPGELEDFVSHMIPEGDPVWPMAQQYIQGIPSKDRKFSSGKILRAEIHAWLATRQEPRKMGLAIKAGDLAVDASIVGNFVNWLQQLFVDS